MAADGLTVGDQPLQGRSALVAGATGGIGSAVARELGRRGATLTLVGRDQSRLERLAVDGHRVALDLRLPEDCGRAVEAARSHGGQLDVVVNAVGVVAFGAVDTLSSDVMEELFLTNTFAAMMLTQASLAGMRDGGVVVNISGIVAETPLPGMAAYAASKAALRSFDHAASREARRRKIRVIDARPPHTETGLAERPLAGSAPEMPPGLEPEAVAATIVDAIVGDVRDLPSAAFGPRR